MHIFVFISLFVKNTVPSMKCNDIKKQARGKYGVI